MGSSKNILVEGIVLHSNDYKDYDKIITIFTKDFGKMQFLAKGVRKINSKNRSSIDIFTYGEYLLNKGPLLKWALRARRCIKYFIKCPTHYII